MDGPLSNFSKGDSEIHIFRAILAYFGIVWHVSIRHITSIGRARTPATGSGGRILSAWAIRIKRGCKGVQRPLPKHCNNDYIDYIDSYWFTLIHIEWIHIESHWFTLFLGMWTAAYQGLDSITTYSQVPLWLADDLCFPMVQFKISRDADLGLHLNAADVLEDTLVAKLCLGDSPGILSFHFLTSAAAIAHSWVWLLLPTIRTRRSIVCMN